MEVKYFHRLQGFFVEGSVFRHVGIRGVFTYCDTCHSMLKVPYMPRGIMHVVITECQGVFIITHTQDMLDNLHGTPKVLSEVSRTISLTLLGALKHDFALKINFDP